MSARCRGEPPTSESSTSRSLIANPASGVRRSSITSTTVGVVVAAPSSLPAVSAETTTEVAPDCRSRCTFSDSRTDATMRMSGASSRAVSVTRTAVSSRLVATTIALASGTPATRSTLDRVALPATVTRPAAEAASSWVRSVSTTTISVGLGAVAQQRLDRGAPLGAVADDDGVVTHAGPPALDPERLPRPLGEQLDRGADEGDEEDQPQRCDHDGGDQPGGVADRDDVAVAGGGDGNRGVVERVGEGDLACAVGVPVAVPAEVDDQRRDHEGAQRDREPLQERQQR